jgi:hypothetical protein
MPLIIEWAGSLLPPSAGGTALGTTGGILVGPVPETSGGAETPEPSTGLFIDFEQVAIDQEIPLGLKPVSDGFEIQDALLTSGANNSGMYFCYPRRSYVPQDLSWKPEAKGAKGVEVASFNPSIPYPRPIVSSTNYLSNVISLNFYRQPPEVTARIGRWPFRTDFEGSMSGVQVGIPTIKWPLRALDVALLDPPVDPDVIYQYERTRHDYNFLRARTAGEGVFARFFLPGIVGYNNYSVFGLSGDGNVLIDRQEGAWTWIARLGQELLGDEDIRWTVTWNQMAGRGIQTRTVPGGPYRRHVLARRRKYNFIVRTKDLLKNNDFEWFTLDSGIGVVTPEDLPTDLRIYCGLDYISIFFPVQKEASRFSLGTPINAMSNINAHLVSGSDQPLPFGTPYTPSFSQPYIDGVRLDDRVPIVHTGYLEVQCFIGPDDTPPIGSCIFWVDPAQVGSSLGWEPRRIQWPAGPTI